MAGLRLHTGQGCAGPGTFRRRHASDRCGASSRSGAPARCRRDESEVGQVRRFQRLRAQYTVRREAAIDAGVIVSGGAEDRWLHSAATALALARARDQRWGDAPGAAPDRAADGGRPRRLSGECARMAATTGGVVAKIVCGPVGLLVIGGFGLWTVVTVAAAGWRPGKLSAMELVPAGIAAAFVAVVLVIALWIAATTPRRAAPDTGWSVDPDIGPELLDLKAAFDAVIAGAGQPEPGLPTVPDLHVVRCTEPGLSARRWEILGTTLFTVSWRDLDTSAYENAGRADFAVGSKGA